MDEVTRLQPPPLWLIGLINPPMRKLLRTRAGKRIPVALLCFDGRRSGRRFELPVSVHHTDEGWVVLTDARWSLNLRDGAPAELVWRGESMAVRAVVVEDSPQAGRLVRSIVAAGTPARRMGIAVPQGHRVTDEEARLRTVLLLTPR